MDGGGLAATLVVHDMNRRGKLFPLHSREQELSDCFAAALFRNSGDGLIFLLVLVLVVDWAEAIMGIERLMLGLDLVCSILPEFLVIGMQ